MSPWEDISTEQLGEDISIDQQDRIAGRFVAAPSLEYPHSRTRMNHWGFVLAAYAVVALVLLGYWWRVERRIRELETEAGGRQS